MHTLNPDTPPLTGATTHLRMPTCTHPLMKACAQQREPMYIVHAHTHCPGYKTTLPAKYCFSAEHYYLWKSILPHFTCFTMARPDWLSVYSNWMAELSCAAFVNIWDTLKRWVLEYCKSTVFRLLVVLIPISFFEPSATICFIIHPERKFRFQFSFFCSHELIFHNFQLVTIYLLYNSTKEKYSGFNIVFYSYEF